MNGGDDAFAKRQLREQLSIQGFIYYKQGQHKKAAEMLEAALTIAQEIGDRNGEIFPRLGNLGHVFSDLGQYDKAAEKYEAALEIAREIGDRNGEVGLLSDLGTVCRALRKYDKAAEMLEAALVIAQEIGDREGEKTNLGNLGVVYMKLGQYDMATKKIEAGLEIAREIGDREGEGAMLGNLGVLFSNLGQYDRAAKKYEAALEVAQKIGDRNGESTWFCNLGTVYINLGRYDKATKMIEAGLEIAREVGNRKGEAGLLGNLGNAFSNLGQHDKAVGMLETGLEIAREIRYRNGEGGLLADLGNVYMKLGQYDTAAEKYKAGLVIAREIGDRNGEGARLGNLGVLFSNLGQYDKAAEMLEAALGIAREIRNKNRESTWLGDLGNVYNNLGHYDKAAEMYEAGLKIAQEIGDRLGEGAKLGNLGTVYMNLQEYDRAVKTYEAGLEIAREIGDRNGESAWLGHLGIIFRKLGQYDKATKMLEDGLKIAREIGDSNREGLWLGNLGVCHYAKSDNLQHHKKALDYLQQSIRVFDDLWMDIKEDDQKVTFDDVNGSSSTFVNYLYSLYWNTGYFKDALLTCEQASSKSLELLLLNHRKEKAKVENSSKQQKTVTTFEQMRNIAIQSKSAIIVYGLHVDEDILIWVIKSGNATKDISLVHEKVPVKKECKTLQYLVELTRRSLGASDRKHFTERRNKNRELSSLTMPIIGEDEHSDVFNDSDLHSVEDELRKAQDEPIDGSTTILMKNALRQLYNLLILPIEGALVDEQRLTIIPFGDLFALPFAALLDQKDKHLIEKHVLSFAPSVGTLVELQRNHNIPNDKKGSTVIVGTGANLSGAREEAEQVHNIIITSGRYEREVKKFIGKQATKEVVVDAMQSADIIHLATHGSKDGISLSGLMGKDAKLTMGKVQSLDLQGTKMVVLSACDTFKGDLRTDGVVGITRSFLAAGSSTVIASLWPVGDNSTKEMMIRLYKYLFQEKECADVNDRDDGKGGGDDTVNVSYALQQVMIGMLKEKGGIFDVKQWAPFLVYGLNTSVDN